MSILFKMSQNQPKRQYSTPRGDALKQFSSRLFARVSHDLGTPMSALRGYIKMVVDGRAGAVTEAQREYLTIALESADRLCSLATRVGKIPDFIDQLQAEPVEIRGEWAEAVNSRRSALLQGAITVRESSLADRLLVAGDRKQLRMVFERVMDVYIQSAQLGSGNEILAEFSRGRERNVNIRIRLSGDGIPATADLSAAHNIIFLHGGDLSLEIHSSTGGSTCIINLPEAT
jgi:K+-sensing histidine kinase KdpD